MPFTKVAISYCKNIYYYKDSPLYYYVMNENSLMHNKSLLNEKYALDSYNIVKNKCCENLKSGLEIIFIKECLYSMLSTLIQKKESKSEINKTLNLVTRDYPNWYLNKDKKKLGLIINFILFCYKKSIFFPVKILFIIRGVVYD